MDLRKQRTLKLLGDSLRSLLNEKPYEQITVAEICQGAMVRRATFYRHFNGKDQLLARVIAEERARIDAQVDPDGSLGLADYCHQMTVRFLQLLEEKRPLLNTQSLSPQFSGTILLFADEIAARFADKLHGHDPRADSAEIKIIAAFYANGLVGAVRSYMDGNAPNEGETFLVTMDTIAERLFRVD